MTRAQGKRNRQAHRDLAVRRKAAGRPNLGYACLHTAVDDHSRLAYTEILADETKKTAAAFLGRAHAWFAAARITIEPVISDNGSCYQSRLWAQTCTTLGVTPKRTRPYRPQTKREGRTLPVRPDALSYPRFSREELEERFLGLMAYLDPKGEGD
jgi:transposase InsO family protein